MRKGKGYLQKCYASKNDDIFVHQEVVSLSDEHWMNFPPAHPFVVDIVGILFGLLTVINFVGNGCTIFLFLKVNFITYVFMLYKKLVYRYIQGIH